MDFLPWDYDAATLVVGPGLFDTDLAVLCAGPEAPGAPDPTPLERLLFAQHSVTKAKTDLAQLELAHNELQRRLGPHLARHSLTLRALTQPEAFDR